MKSHEIAQVVNQLRDIALEFHGAQQLRERIAGVIVPLLKKPARHADPVLTLSPEDTHEAFIKNFPKTRISQAWIDFAADIARAVANRVTQAACDPTMAANSRRYLTLRNSLSPVHRSHTAMPHITTPLNPDCTYLAEGLDELLDRIADEMGSSDAQALDVTPIDWPKAKDVGRLEDMGKGHLRVGLDSDNDVYVSVWNEDGGASVEFCTPGSGGGKSSRTRMALIGLMVAMEADNIEVPGFDWWARRNGTGQATEPRQ